MSDHVLFAGPWVKGTGERPTRIVLHADTTAQGEVRKFIVHKQYRDEQGQLHYENGEYIHAEWANAQERSIRLFGVRCVEHYQENRKLLYLDQPDDVFLETLATDPNQ